MPHPQWVKVKHATIPDAQTSRAADLIRAQLGEDGVKRVGGATWWEWRKPQSPLRAEWIEMRADYQDRKKGKEPGNRVMLYVHGGAYYFGSVDEHRYQMQRHARKLKARVFAPEYRLAPQFPFPCGVQDCLAAYLFLLETIEPSAIVLAGDSAGGGMVMSLLVILRDQGVPMPAGAVLISPWVDLTHSFPSVAGENPLDYIPPCGFHHKPSMAWPPPNAEEMGAIRDGAKVIREALGAENRSGNVESRTAAVDSVPLEQTAGDDENHRRQSEAVERMLTVDIDGKKVKLTDQIQVRAPLFTSLINILTDTDVRHQRPPLPPPRQPRPPNDPRRPPTTPHNGRRRRDAPRRADLPRAQVRQPGQVRAVRGRHDRGGQGEAR